MEVTELYSVIAKEVKRLRLEKANMSLLAFSKEIGLSRKVYEKIEKGRAGDYYVSSLQRALSYYKGMTLAKFFKQAGL